MNNARLRIAPSLGLAKPTEQLQMLNKIKSIMLNKDNKLNSYDQAVVKNEDVVKVLLGIDFSSDDHKVVFSSEAISDRKLSTPIQDLLSQMNVLKSTELNTGLLRTVYAIMLNGRTADLYHALKTNFPEYH